MSYAEKERLLKLGKKNRRGPLNSVVDHDQVGEGSALMEVTEAVKESGKYNVWDADDVEENKSKFKVRSVFFRCSVAGSSWMWTFSGA